VFKKTKTKKTKHNSRSKEFDKGILSWSASEYHDNGAGKYYKGFIVLFLVAIMIFGLIFDSWTFALAIGVFLVVQHMVHKNDNPFVEVKISKIGIKVGKRCYRFSDIKGFWIIDEDYLSKMLVINVKDDIAGEVHIQLGDQEIDAVKTVLAKYIKEKKGKSISFMDHISLLFKF